MRCTDVLVNEEMLLPMSISSDFVFQINVRRGFLYEDAFEKLSPENEQNMKLRMRVQMQNAVGRYLLI